MSENFSKILRTISSAPFDAYHTDISFQELLLSEGFRLGYKKKGQFLVYYTEKINAIHILLEGYCCIEKYSPDGRLITNMNIAPLQYFGLFEAIHKIAFPSVSIRCLSDCYYIKIPVSVYLKHLKNDTELMWYMLQYLSEFISKTLFQDDKLLLNEPRQNILHKLYELGINKEFPLIIPIKKQDLAYELNMNVRTLYRKLDLLYKEGLLSASKGKILITQRQYSNIAELLEYDMPLT